MTVSSGFWRYSTGLALAFCAAAWGQSDPAVALVSVAGQARLLRQGSQLDIALRNGDLLFAGDRISVTGPAATVWFCPASQVVQLDPQSIVRFDATRLTPVSGRLGASQSAPFCPVPPVKRDTLARPAYLGQEVSRG